MFFKPRTITPEKFIEINHHLIKMRSAKVERCIDEPYGKLSSDPLILFLSVLSETSLVLWITTTTPVASQTCWKHWTCKHLSKEELLLLWYYFTRSEVTSSKLIITILYDKIPELHVPHTTIKKLRTMASYLSIS